MNVRILVVDDEEVIRNSIERVLKKSNYEVFTADCGTAALKAVEQQKPDIILLDINMEDLNGIEVLKQVKAKSPEIIVIMITAFGSIESAIAAMKAGAYDYIQKPFTAEQIRKPIRNALETLALKKEVEELRQRQMKKNNFDKIIGNSDEIQHVLSLVKQFAPSNTTILIEGESGTGKELIAEYIHYLSPRYAKPYIILNCGAVPRELLESELFGYEKGAFTGASAAGKNGLIEQANHGTLFLDEVGEMHLEAQVKLLRVLENSEYYRVGSPQLRKVDLRIIAATNVPLAKLVEEGKFRKDLYYRLNIAKIELPPLRERKKDIIPLAKYFIDHFNKHFGKRVKGMASDVEDALLAHPLPGNVRELRNIIERVMLLTNGDIIKLSDLEMAGISSHENSLNIVVKLNDRSNGNVLHRTTLEIIKKTLAISQNNKTHAAKLLGIPRSTLRHYLTKFDNSQQ